jgi:hypothetical protein
MRASPARDTLPLWFGASVSRIVRHRTVHRFARTAGAARCGLRPPRDTLPRSQLASAPLED